MNFGFYSIKIFRKNFKKKYCGWILNYTTQLIQIWNNEIGLDIDWVLYVKNWIGLNLS